MIYFSQLPEITGGRLIQYQRDTLIEHLSVDSRKASAQKGAIFFAIKGDRHDGHVFIGELYRLGTRQFVVEQLPQLSEFPEANFLLVSSAIAAVQQIAAFHRKSFSIPVIGITGSNGKTIIKEWLFQMLAKDQIVVKNPGSYNSQVGVPLSVWQMQPHHQLAIFEAGISRPGEMDNLEKVIQPTIGILTNIGTAHDEGFSSQDQKLTEKLKLFKHVQVMIYCSDMPTVRQAVHKSGLKAFSWGRDPDADVVITPQGDKCQVSRLGQSHTFILPFTDAASFENCMHCITVMMYLGFGYKKIQKSINVLRSVPMRMEMKEGINQSYLIDDTYNNDLGGLELTLQFLSHQNQKKKRRVILSDILESGLPEEDLANRIRLLLEKYHIQNFVGIGPMLTRHQRIFQKQGHFFTSSDEFVKNFEFDSIADEVILIKGARTFAFENIVKRLQRKVHGTVMEVDLGALVHNLNFFRSAIKPETKLMVMVKAFAYGSGSAEVANVLQYHKVNFLGVAYVDEGVDLRKNNIMMPIMVMNPSEDSFNQLLDYDLQPEVYNFKMLRALLRYLDGRACQIHLKLDTGMHRLGFERPDIPQLIQLLIQNTNLHVASVFSHLAAADESEQDEYSKEQAGKFLEFATTVQNALGYKPLFHILNSSGIIRFPQYQFDMVRLGIGLYGVDPTQGERRDLKAVATLKTVISQIKNIKKGDSIGYGRRGMAEHDITIATIAIGYADGFSRKLSRGIGEVLIAGKRGKVIGNVCMDMTMIDISGIDANEGDEVIIFGDHLPIEEMASRIQTIPYEILTNVSSRVKRVFVSDGI